MCAQQFNTSQHAALYHVQVKLVGTFYSFGDIGVATGDIVRRTNDIHVSGRFLLFSHRACDLPYQTDAALTEMRQLLTEEHEIVKSQRGIVSKDAWITAPSSGLSTPQDEALMYLWAASIL
jgi:hypothetical protein